MIRPILALMTLAVCSCTLSPITFKDVAVTPKKGAQTLTVNEPMIWYDSAVNPKKGIRISPGIYPLQAEDNQNYYFKSPKGTEVRTFRNGQIMENRNLTSGLCLAKGFSAEPAGIYVDVTPTQKTIFWRLGSAFLSFEGKKWNRNF